MEIPEQKYSDEIIKSAHDKQRRKVKGQGGILFTAQEQEVIDKHIPFPVEPKVEPVKPTEEPLASGEA